MFINFCSFRIHCTLANHWNIWNSQPSKIAFVTAMEEPVFSNIYTVTMKHCERNSWTLFYTSPKYLKSLACSSLSSLSSTLEDEFIDRCKCCKSLNLRWSKTANNPFNSKFLEREKSAKSDNISMNKGDRAFKYLFTPYSLINRQNVRESRMKMGFVREGNFLHEGFTTSVPKIIRNIFRNTVTMVGTHEISEVSLKDDKILSTFPQIV